MAFNDTINITAEPSRITAGGTVLVTAEPPSETGEFEVEWFVIGPTQVEVRDLRISVLGTTISSAGKIAFDGSNTQPLLATLDTSALAVGAWRVGVRMINGPDNDQFVVEGLSDWINVVPRPFASGDDVAVTMKRAAVLPTSDQALWVAIRNSANAMGFESYTRFMEVVMCGEWPDRADGLRLGKARHELRKVGRRTALPFPNVDRYRLLKAATEVFLMLHCGVELDDFSRVDLVEESRRLQRKVQPGDLEEEMRDYLERVATGSGEFLDVLPYLALIRRQLRDVVVTGGDDEDDAAEVCYGIISERLAHPCFLELLWSYWHDEGGLVQTLNAIAWRFQNRPAGPPGRDPLAGLEIDPLRPLSNLLWGWIQDTQHRLTVARRAYEYDHEYGLVLSTKPGRPVRGADSRSRFIESFHNLLVVCAEFYIRDDDTTVIADGFGVLNALKETHIVLTQGAHNQYGDLPWTARHEMLMGQWILSRPEMREFLPTRTMVVEPELWISRVEAMNRLQGWHRRRRPALPRPRRVRRAAAARHPLRVVDDGERAGARGELGALLACRGAALHPCLPGSHRRRPDPPARSGDPRVPPPPPAAGPQLRRRVASTVIDADCHAGPGDGFSGPWDAAARLGRYLRRCDAAGIARSNLFAAFHTDYGAANEAVGRIVAGCPQRLLRFRLRPRRT